MKKQTKRKSKDEQDKEREDALFMVDLLRILRPICERLVREEFIKRGWPIKKST